VMVEYLEIEYCMAHGLTDEEIEEGWDFCYEGLLIKWSEISRITTNYLTNRDE